MRLRIAVALLALGMAVAHAMSPADELIIFGKTSSASGSNPGCAYGKLRRAELRRNPWVFSLKRTVIRAIDVTTMLVAPALWSGAVTYYRGSIVADSAGTLWVSRIPNNSQFRAAQHAGLGAVFRGDDGEPLRRRHQLFRGRARLHRGG
jgi:hypothetical protein